MRKCMIYFLVVALLCGSLLAACAPEEAVASHPGTTVPKHTTRPTQTQTKPTETQPKPTEPKPTETQPNPTETLPTVPTVTYPISMDYSYQFLTTDLIRWGSNGMCNIWVLNSEDDREALSDIGNMAELLIPYDIWYFDTHFLIVAEYTVNNPDIVDICPTQVQRMEDGSFHLELDCESYRGYGNQVTYIYYLLIEVKGTCDEDAHVTVSLERHFIERPEE